MPVEIPWYLQFPPRARAAIVGAEAQAETAFRDVLSHIEFQTVGRGTRVLGHKDKERIRLELAALVTAAVARFSTVACEEARAGRYPIDLIANQVDTRLKAVAHNAYYHIEHDKMKAVWSTDYACEQEVARAVKNGEGWRSFLGALAEAASALASEPQASPAPAADTAQKSGSILPPALSEAPAASPAIDDLVSLKTAADHLGVHEDTVRRMGGRGQIELRRVGRRLQVPSAELSRLCGTGDYPKPKPPV